MLNLKGEVQAKSIRKEWDAHSSPTALDKNSFMADFVLKTFLPF